ncbi:type II secretion system F family protein [Paenarthrobacter sp. DKR-5]|uniref:type II secretion system F family protein n=1 Tax=Paenarthrobacter sp. DKR-5 TaxID=2835535 RepID=UPI001BDD475E|nr:type II secretion system F family protein [Paenarthrobacter sp. DKR-5]MBT1001582.1 type II secretion system F family protein [Paenarthrobacter sp. DKR-5]
MPLQVPLSAGPEPAVLVLGLVLCYAAAAAVLLVLFPPRPKVTLELQSGAEAEPKSRLTGITSVATHLAETILRQLKGAPALSSALEIAGLKLRPADFIVIVAAPAVVLALVGVTLGGPLVGLLFAILAAVAAKLVLGVLASRRRAAFNDQLDDSLQLMASGLRAGHSLLRAVDALATEADAPTSEEFARIINETRLGRDLGEALDAAAARMQSEDFLWVAQAIAIHREVGGNLAEVLDQVGQTIRERNQIRRQIKALSAEGRMSAVVLGGLPFGMGAVLFVISPSYISKLVETPIGLVLLAIGAVLLVIGSLWLRKVVSFKF